MSGKEQEIKKNNSTVSKQTFIICVILIMCTSIISILLTTTLLTLRKDVKENLQILKNLNSSVAKISSNTSDAKEFLADLDENS